MPSWTAIKDLLVSRRKEEEFYLARAMEEFHSGEVRPGLLAKAALKSGGDKARATTVYLQLLAKAIRDDDYIRQRQGSAPSSQWKNTDQPQQTSEETQNSLPYAQAASIRKIGACAVLSMIVPGLGQFILGRPTAGFLHLTCAIVLWIIGFGWIMHLWSPSDAVWPREGKY